MITLLVGPAELGGSELEVTGDAHRHLFRARRAAVGERLRVVDGEGGARFGEVVRVDRRMASVRLGEAAPAGDPVLRVTLLVAPPKPERAVWLVEKAAELGVAAVRFVHCERAPRAYGAAAIARLGRVAAAALQQAQGARLTAVSGVHAWSDMEELLAGRGPRYLLDPSAPALPPTLSPDAGGVAIVVGPEGGFTAAETAALVRLDCAAAGLGARVLRVETAAVVAAGALLAGGGGARAPHPAVR